MAKNQQVFAKSTQGTATENPVAAAQAASDAAAEVAQATENAAAAAAVGEETGAAVLEDTVVAKEGAAEASATAASEINLDTLVVKATAEAPTAAAAPAAAQASVVDTTVAREVEQQQTVKVAHRQPLAGTVARPAGGRQREASPVDSNRLAQPAASTGFKALVENEKQNGTVSAISFVAFFESYIKTMQPGRATSTAEVIRCQEGMLDNLTFVITTAPANEFKRLWNLAIAYFSEYKDSSLSPRYYGRGAKDWKRDPGQFLVLTSLVNLLEVSATDIDSVHSQVDVGAIADKGFSEEARGRLIGFYSK